MTVASSAVKIVRAQEVLREIALLIPEIKVEVTLLGPGMMDHPKRWITHEGLTVNGRKGLYHDVLPQPAWKNNVQHNASETCEDTPEETVEPEPQAEVARKPSSKKASKQKTVILASAAVPAHEHLLSPPVREVPACLL